MEPRPVRRPEPMAEGERGAGLPGGCNRGAAARAGATRACPREGRRGPICRRPNRAGRWGGPRVTPTGFGNYARVCTHKRRGLRTTPQKVRTRARCGHPNWPDEAPDHSEFHLPRIRTGLQNSSSSRATGTCRIRRAARFPSGSSWRGASRSRRCRYPGCASAPRPLGSALTAGYRCLGSGLASHVHGSGARHRREWPPQRDVLDGRIRNGIKEHLRRCGRVTRSVHDRRTGSYRRIRSREHDLSGVRIPGSDAGKCQTMWTLVDVAWRAPRAEETKSRPDWTAAQASGFSPGRPILIAKAPRWYVVSG